MLSQSGQQCAFRGANPPCRPDRLSVIGQNLTQKRIRFKCSPTIIVERLKPHFLRTDRAACPVPPPKPRPDGIWRPRARRSSASPSSIGSRTRAGSSGASGAAARRPVHPRRRLPDADRRLRRRARSTRFSIRPPCWVSESLTRVAPSGWIGRRDRPRREVVSYRSGKPT